MKKEIVGGAEVVTMKLTFIKDKKDEGYTVISSDYPAAVAERETVEEVLKNISEQIYELSKLDKG